MAQKRKLSRTEKKKPAEKAGFAHSLYIKFICSFVSPRALGKGIVKFLTIVCSTII